MATFVLVHGAMHGGWCWRDVRQRLQSLGHDVYAPTLTGQGCRRGSLNPGVGVSTHVRDISELMWFEDLAEVHLVLHSYAGVLAGPVAERQGDRLASAIFVGAFLTRPGECLLDVEPPAVAERYRRMAAQDGGGWLIPARADFLDQWGIDDDGLRARVAPRLTDFPLRCQTEPALYDPSNLAALRKVYVDHLRPALPSLQRFYQAAVAAGWETHQLACGHDMMLTAPDATAALLHSIVDGAAVGRGA